MTRMMTRKSRGLRYLVVAMVAMLVLAPATAVAVPSPPDEVFGTVTDQNGNAVDGITVTVTDEDGNAYTDTTGADGYYEIKFPAEDGEAGETLTVSVKDSSKTTPFESGASEKMDFSITVEEATTPPDDGDDGDDRDDPPASGGGGGQPADDDDGDAVDEPASKAVALAGTNPTVQVDDGESMSMVGFGSQTDLDDTVSITEVTESPSPAPQGATFVTGAEITFSSTNGEDVDTVQMGVRQSRLDELDVPADRLVIHHLDVETDEWEALETEVASEDGSEVVLEAPSAGFSTYAVFAQEQAETTTSTTQQPTTTTEAPTTTTEVPTTTTDAPPTTTPTDGSGPGPVLIGGIVVVVLAVLAALYLAFGRE